MTKSAREEIIARFGDYGRCFSTSAGLKVLKDMRKSYSLNSTFDPNPFVMAHKEGQREVILNIESMLKMVRSKKLQEFFFPETEEED